MLERVATSPEVGLAPKPRSLRSVDPACLAHDDVLAGIPTQFVRDVLRDLSPRLLSGINCTTLDHASTPAADKRLPAEARCTFDPSLAPQTCPLAPNFLLALTFPPRDPRASPVRLLVPCHSLVYTLWSPLFPYISDETPDASDASSEPASQGLEGPTRRLLVLPILGPIELPSVETFSILHAFLHSRSVEALEHSLTTKLASTSRLPSPPPSPRLEPRRRGGSSSSSPSRTRRTSTKRPLSPTLELEDARELLVKIQDLRTTCVRFEISDPTLWHTMANSWQHVVSQYESNVAAPSQ
ncbi:hypothetical protein JCM3766R1_002766 [Sporobolomyces carnicolor]